MLMRNDARPMGEDEQNQSPIDEHQNPVDSRDSVTHDRQSSIINEEAARDARPRDHDIEPTMPTDDSTLNIKI
jgi:hypothetical protein